MYTHLSDLELANTLYNGNTVGFKELYSRHADKLLHLAIAKIDSLQDAEDCVQEVFCNFWQHCLDRPAPFQDINLEAYLVTSVKHYVFRYYRRQLRSKIIQEQVVRNTPESGSTTEEYLSSLDIMGLLREELDDMPEQMRKVFEMSRSQDLTIKEIAFRLELSEQTVKNHMSRALRRLRLRLGPQLLSLFL
jgi:RNA polymerase sigma-70 factor (family 1)